MNPSINFSSLDRWLDQFEPETCFYCGQSTCDCADDAESGEEVPELEDNLVEVDF